MKWGSLLNLDIQYSSDPFYIVSYYIKKRALLLGYTVITIYIPLNFNGTTRLLQPGMRIRIRIRSDPLIFGQPDPVLFSTDPDPTCYNGSIKLFLSWTKYESESTTSSIKWWVIILNFIPTYLKCKYIFFFISISGQIRIRNFFPAEPDPDPWKKNFGSDHPWF